MGGWRVSPYRATRLSCALGVRPAAAKVIPICSTSSTDASADEKPNCRVRDEGDEGDEGWRMEDGG